MICGSAGLRDAAHGHRDLAPRAPRRRRPFITIIIMIIIISSSSSSRCSSSSSSSSISCNLLVLFVLVVRPLSLEAGAGGRDDPREEERGRRARVRRGEAGLGPGGRHRWK